MNFVDSQGRTTGVLFVCTGNICRSPTAEGVFRALAARAGVTSTVRAESAGTHGFHVGEPPDRRAVLAARARGYDIATLRARTFAAEHFNRFDWIVAMDEANLRVLTELRPSGFTGHLELLMNFVPDAQMREIPDPYYGGPEGFERVLDLVELASEALLLHVVRASKGNAASTDRREDR